MKKYLFIMAVSLSMPIMAATSDTIRLCGYPRPYYENGNEIFVLFVMVSSGDYLNGYYAYAPDLAPQWSWLSSSGVPVHICADYQLPIESNINGVIKFSAGTADQSSLICQYNLQYTGASCAACPTGYVAKIPTLNGSVPDYMSGLHTNTSCAYCDTGYYRSGSSCVKCPNSGRTENYNSSSIGNCYTYSGTNDQTGTYERQKCYYQ